MPPISAIESLEIKRKPFPDMEAVYFVSATPEAVDLLVADYTSGKPPYLAAHIFFSSALPQTLAERIRSSPMQKYIRQLQEIPLDFIAYGSHSFSLDLPISLQAVMNATSLSLLNYQLDPVAKRLVAALATMGEYPHIRYYNPTPTQTTILSTGNSSSSLAGRLAQLVQQGLDDLCRNDSSYPPALPFPTRSILMIVDRGIDPVAPLLHEFSYQAMLNDLVPMDLDGCKYTKEDGSSVVFDETDPVFLSQRFRHIADVMQTIAEEVKKFSSENKAAYFERNNMEGGQDVSQLKETLAALPQYQEMKEKFALHTNMCQELISIYQDYDHEKIAKLEQDIATGLSADGRSVTKLISKDVENILSDRKISRADKLRLLMLHIICQDGIPDNEREKLFEIAKLSMEEYQAITNLSNLGVRLSPAMEDRTKNQPIPYKLAHLRATRTRTTPPDFENSRYIPVVQHMLEDQSKNGIDSAMFPWIKEPPSSVNNVRGSVGSDGSGDYVPRAKANWARRASDAGSGTVGRNSGSNSSSIFGKNESEQEDLRKNGPRIILFIMGGMTFSELKAAHVVMTEQKRDIVIGSTHTINPHYFVDTLKSLHRPGFPRLSRHPYPKIVQAPVTSPRGESSRSRGSSAASSKSRSRSEVRPREGDERDRDRDRDRERPPADSRERTRSSRSRPPRPGGRGEDPRRPPPPSGPPQEGERDPRSERRPSRGDGDPREYGSRSKSVSSTSRSRGGPPPMPSPPSTPPASTMPTWASGGGNRGGDPRQQIPPHSRGGGGGNQYAGDPRMRQPPGPSGYDGGRDPNGYYPPSNSPQPPRRSGPSQPPMDPRYNQPSQPPMDPRYNYAPPRNGYNGPPAAPLPGRGGSSRSGDPRAMMYGEPSRGGGGGDYNGGGRAPPPAAEEKKGKGGWFSRR
ncbi:vacuolar sorting protein VPS33/slp1 [Chytridiales sp. JEL 0842]|nr:vacuolar sorting protein VPS33/slp1 [Chytridiales sp. JEL 0842]